MLWWKCGLRTGVAWMSFRRSSNNDLRTRDHSDGYGNIATAVSAVKLGAHDYLTKPVYVDDTAGIPLAIG